jgi:hypothetical protein
MSDQDPATVFIFVLMIIALFAAIDSTLNPKNDDDDKGNYDF